LYINSLINYYGNKYKKDNDIIWKGTWNQFKNKVKNHGKV